MGFIKQLMRPNLDVELEDLYSHPNLTIGDVHPVKLNRHLRSIVAILAIAFGCSFSAVGAYAVHLYNNLEPSQRCIGGAPDVEESSNSVVPSKVLEL